MHQRERLLAIEPRDNGMVAWSLRAHRVRDAADYFEDILDQKADPAMIQIAQKIIACGRKGLSILSSSTTAMKTPCAS